MPSSIVFEDFNLVVSHWSTTVICRCLPPNFDRASILFDLRACHRTRTESTHYRKSGGRTISTELVLRFNTEGEATRLVSHSWDYRMQSVVVISVLLIEDWWLLLYSLIPFENIAVFAHLFWARLPFKRYFFIFVAHKIRRSHTTWLYLNFGIRACLRIWR